MCSRTEVDAAHKSSGEAKHRSHKHANTCQQSTKVIRVRDPSIMLLNSARGCATEFDAERWYLFYCTTQEQSLSHYFRVFRKEVKVHNATHMRHCTIHGM